MGIPVMADSGYIPGTVDHELLLRNEYLAAENRILRGQLKGRLKFSDAERAKLGEIGRRLGRKALGEVATERACLALCNGRAQSSCIIRFEQAAKNLPPLAIQMRHLSFCVFGTRRSPLRQGIFDREQIFRRKDHVQRSKRFGQTLPTTSTNNWHDVFATR